MFCRKHEVILASGQNDDGFSWLCLREKGNIYLLSPTFFCRGVVFCLSTKWDMFVWVFFARPFLYLPVQIHVNMKNTPIIWCHPENQRLEWTVERAVEGNIPLMASSSRCFWRWITPINREWIQRINPAPYQMCCQQLHTAHHMAKRPRDSKQKSVLSRWEPLFCTTRVSWLGFSAKIAGSQSVLHNFSLPVTFRSGCRKRKNANGPDYGVLEKFPSKTREDPKKPTSPALRKCQIY